MSDIKVAAVLQPHNDYTDTRKQYENGLYSAEDDYTGLILVSVKSVIKCLLESRKYVILKFSISKAGINEAAVLQPHNGYSDIRKQYETGLYSAEDDYT